MGWSCTMDAGNTMDKMHRACLLSTGTANAWKDPQGNQYFWEIGRENIDGHISAAVYKIEGKFCRKVGSIYISPDGSIKRMPASLRKILDKSKAG